jgi:hypothetical protein
MSPERSSFAPCAPPSRTPAAPRSAVAPLCCALLDGGCARRTAKNAVGTEKRLSIEQRN